MQKLQYIKIVHENGEASYFEEHASIPLSRLLYYWRPLHLHSPTDVRKNAADIHVIKLEFVPRSRSVLEALHLASSSLLLSPQPDKSIRSPSVVVLPQ